MFVSMNIVPGSTQVHLAFSPLVVHGQGQRWPAGNSTFVCAKKGSSQRNAFTCVISFDSMQLPLGKVGALVPTLQMRELRLRGVRQVAKITDLTVVATKSVQLLPEIHVAGTCVQLAEVGSPEV